MLVVFADELYQINESAAVTDFVVVPTHDFDHLVDDRGEQSVEKAGMGVANDVDRHDWVFGVVENAFEMGLRRDFESCIDLLDGDLAFDIESDVCQGAVGHGHSDAATAEFAVEIGENFGQCFGCSCGGWHNGLAGSTSATKVFVGLVMQALVGGIGVNCGDVGLVNATEVVQDFEHWRGIVGGATCV